MLQLSSKLNPLALEARHVLNGCYPKNETGYAAQATMAIINHNQEDAKVLITELSGSRAGRNAIISELRSLEREGWYRSLRDFLSHVPQAAFEDYEDNSVGNLLRNAYSGMIRLGVSKVANSFKELISRQHPRFKGYLSDQEVPSIAESPTDHIVHTLRGREANQDFPDFSCQEVVDAFNDYLRRERLSWAAELLDFCYVSSSHSSALLEADAVGELVKAMTSAESVITLRFFAHVVRDKPLYREGFEGLLGIAER